MRDSNFTTEDGTLNLHPIEAAHCVPCKNEYFFDSYGCAPPKPLTDFIIETNGKCVFIEYKFHGRDRYCAVYCLHIIYLTKKN